MAITGRQMDEAHKRHRKWLKTASLEERRAFLEKANPAVKGLDLPLEEQYYKPRRKARRRSKKKRPRK